MAAARRRLAHGISFEGQMNKADDTYRQGLAMLGLPVGEDRHWDSELQRWVWPADIDDALNAAQVAISEYYNNPDRSEAERWLLKAYAANQPTINPLDHEQTK